MYKIGDYVVKANNGICLVNEISHLDMPGVDKDKKYYFLLPKSEKKAVIYVPVGKENNGIRKVMTEEEAWAVIKEVPEIEAAWVMNDKQREQIYKEAVLSCDPRQLISIIKNLYERKRIRTEQGKANTTMDERYFKIAEENLYSELAFAIHREQDEIREIIAESVQSC